MGDNDCESINLKGSQLHSLSIWFDKTSGSVKIIRISDAQGHTLGMTNGVIEHAIKNITNYELKTV
eukprot:CAMPEP_0116924852 /NCGR_PEP_ID=MMETSP0467-20121206/23774_1 /TAXON_ID=283647 /ORGANISM="Mesodinium pulex, Strain SPMC105" /LENGTH=65 /DNA_ID=CAMNT_0004603793 /DNA_START=621 /DNA_END=818 /DNA_ORIENTATION=+